jgi:hypothetical protein
MRDINMRNKRIGRKKCQPTENGTFFCKCARCATAKERGQTAISDPYLASSHSGRGRENGGKPPFLPFHAVLEACASSGKLMTLVRGLRRMRGTKFLGAFNTAIALELMFGDPIADSILAALRQSPDGLTRTQISEVFGRHVDAPQLARGLQTLQALGLATPEERPTAGRPATTWRAVRRPV